MAYIIKSIEGNEIIDGGMTREQVIRALQNHQIIAFNETFKHKMPRHGKALFIVKPIGQRSYKIIAV